MSIFAALRETANTFDALSKGVEVAQNNIANATTPGYAKQTLPLYARPFEAGTLVGGVGAGELITARNDFAETQVRQQSGILGSLQQKAQSLAYIEGSFDTTGKAGISAAITTLYQAFSAWSVAPNDASARNQVILAGQTTARAFNQVSSDMTTYSTNCAEQIQNSVGQINELASKIRDLNAARAQTGSADSGAETAMYNTLESLSKLVNITALREADGSVSVLIGGQATLVVGDHVLPVAAQFSHPTAPPPAYPGKQPPARIIDATGNDITGAIGSGELSGLLEIRNTVLAGLIGDGQSAGSLNALAQSFADRVNGILAAGTDRNGNPGKPLFDYKGQPESAAAVIGITAGFAASDLVAADASGANGAALKLAGLAMPQTAADDFIGSYGQIAAGVGQRSAAAQSQQATQQQLVSQAQNLRSQLSGVSLDEEAMNLMVYQRSYQATAKLASVLDQLTQTIIDMMH